MELTELEKELMIVGINNLKQDSKPRWNSFMFLTKAGKERMAEIHKASCDLLYSLEKEFNITYESIIQKNKVN